MTSKIPDGRRSLPRARARGTHSMRWRDAPRVLARTLVYGGLIAASIVLWWAVANLVIGR